VLRFILIAVFVLLALRFLVSIARLLAMGRRQPTVDPGRSPTTSEKRASQFDPSNAIDVPFTEIPPEPPR
jgi:hypothetical protein